MEITLLHATPEAKVDIILREGQRAASAFDDLGIPMRRGVVYCWLRREHDKMWGNNTDYTYIEVTVDRSRCRVADMEWSSLALMYLQGNLKPEHSEAASLLARLYEVTAVSLDDYREGMFFTPEVLVSGDVSANKLAPVD